MCGVSIIPFSLMFNVAGPVLYLGLKVIQLSSADHNVMKWRKYFFSVCLTHPVSFIAEFVGWQWLTAL